MINMEELRHEPNDSITDPETIREIAKSGDNELYDKVKKGFEFCGLYPFEMKKINVLPNKVEKND